MTEQLQKELLQFIGTENWYKHWAGLLHYTDGIKYLADKAGAYWLVDLVASYQHKLKGAPFQLWSIKVNDDKTAVVEMREDIGLEPLVTQRIEFTDFPLADFEFYISNGVLMLKGEY